MSEVCLSIEAWLVEWGMPVECGLARSAASAYLVRLDFVSEPCLAECAMMCRVYTKMIGGPSRTWLSSQLDAELQKQQHGSSQPGVGTEAMLHLRRQITAYQVTCLSLFC